MHAIIAPILKVPISPGKIFAGNLLNKKKGIKTAITGIEKMTPWAELKIIPHTNKKTEVNLLTYPKWMKNALYTYDKFWQNILGKVHFTYFVEQTSTDSHVKFYNLSELRSILKTYNLEIRHYDLFGKQFSRNFFRFIPPGWLVLKDMIFGWSLNELEKIFLHNSNIADGMISLLEKKKQ